MTIDAPPRPLLLCLDLEAGSDQLAQYAHAHAARCDLPVHVLHVVQHPLTDDDVARARQRLARLCREHLPAVAAENLLVAHGVPEEAIVELAARLDAGVIVLGRRRRPTVERIYVGSTTSAVISLARRPVLVMPLAADHP